MAGLRAGHPGEQTSKLQCVALDGRVKPAHGESYFVVLNLKLVTW